MITISNLPSWEPHEIWNILQLEYMSIDSDETVKGDFVLTFSENEDLDELYDIEVEQSLIIDFVQKIKSLSIPLAPKSESGGPDCGSLKLEVNSGLTNIQLHWFGKAANDWPEVKALVLDMLIELRKLPKINRNRV